MKKPEILSEGGGLGGLIDSIRDKALMLVALASLSCAHTVPVKKMESVKGDPVVKCQMSCNREFLRLLTGSRSQQNEGRGLLEECLEGCEEE